MKRQREDMGELEYGYTLNEYNGELSIYVYNRLVATISQCRNMTQVGIKKLVEEVLEDLGYKLN